MADRDRFGGSDRGGGLEGLNVPQRTRSFNPDNPYHKQREYEKFQMRANEPEARALESKVTRGFMDQGYNFPRFTPHRTPAWTTEAAGVSPGGGNSRTFGRPEEWRYSVTPGEWNPTSSQYLKHQQTIRDLEASGALGVGTGLGSLESKIKPYDWRSIQKLLDRGIDPEPYIESVKWDPNPFPKPGQPFPRPWPPRPGGPGEWDIVERGDIQSDWRGQDRLWKNIIQANPGLGEDELMILFQQAMDRATG
jgi:hypothetical protein|tara:strand:+ start:120 stop:869 length:750 start_codon:yes stop_codon:yes gene_type:complete